MCLFTWLYNLSHTNAEQCLFAIIDECFNKKVTITLRLIHTFDSLIINVCTFNNNLLISLTLRSYVCVISFGKIWAQSCNGLSKHSEWHSLAIKHALSISMNGWGFGLRLACLFMWIMNFTSTLIIKVTRMDLFINVFVFRVKYYLSYIEKFLISGPLAQLVRASC